MGFVFRRRVMLLAFAVGLDIAPVVVAPVPARADVVTPAGACVATGHWEKGNFTESSTAHQPADVIQIPRSDTVDWAGNIKGFAVGQTGPSRAISGNVRLDLPIGTATIDSWGGTSVRYGNQGHRSYNLPSVLIGIKLTLHGIHRDNGATTCSGSVNVQIKGSAISNPLFLGAVALLVLSGAGLLYAGRPVIGKV